jgi:mutator protein MutT
MRIVSCAGVIFSDGHRLLLEDRRRIKKHGEHWSFFGGSIEHGETHEQAMKREIQEELSYSIKQYSFFKKYVVKLPHIHITYYMYTAPLPPMSALRVHKDAVARLVTIRQALRLKITAEDKRIIADFSKKHAHA